MIIAQKAPSLPTPVPVDAAGGAPRAAGKDAVDASSDPSATIEQGFGHLLARRMDAGSASDLAKPDAQDATASSGRMLFGPDGQPLAATNATPAGDPDAGSTIAVDTIPLPGAVKGGAPADDATTTATRPDEKSLDATAGNDLAAQLALVSQWAALPPPTAAKAGGDEKSDALDIKGKLDAVRVTSTRSSTDGTATPAATEALQGAVVPMIATLAPQAVDRMARGAPTTTAAVTKVADTKAKLDAQASVAGDRLSLAEAVLGKIDVPMQGSSDATSFAHAFIAQVAAQVSGAQNPAAAAAATPATLQLHETVGTTAWTNEVGQATLRMAANDLQGASLRLNPEHLGPLDVQVRVDNGVAHLAFSAAHAETRQALESSRTTLDQLFADQGLKIGDCAVGDSSRQQRFDADATQGGSSRDGGRWGSSKETAHDTTSSTVTTTVRRALGLVDTFA